MTVTQTKRQRWILIVVSFLAFAWRIRGLSDESLWRDEIDAIFFALRDLPDTLSMFVNRGQNGALFFLSLRPWLRLTGTSEFALRYPAVLFSMLSVALLWQVGRRLMPGRAFRPSERRPVAMLRLIMGSAPLLAAFFLAANPYQLFYGQDGKMYALVTFLALLATWFWLQGINQGGWRPWLGYLVVVSIAMYSHLLMVLLIPLGIAWFFIAWPQSRRHKLGYLLALAGLTLPYLPMLWWHWQLLTTPIQYTLLEFYPLGEVLESLLLNQFLGAQEPGSLLALTPILFLSAAGLLLGAMEIIPRPNGSLVSLPALRRHFLIVAWLLVPVLGIYLLSLRQPVFLPRYVMWIAPAIMMLVALGVQLLWHNESQLGKPIALVMAAYVLIFWIAAGQQQKGQELKPDLRAAVHTIARDRRPDDLLIMQLPNMQYAYGYYTGDRGPDPFQGSEQRLGRWAVGPRTNNDLSDAEARELVDLEMSALTAGSDAIWLLLSEDDLWDQRRLMIEWLDDRGTLLDSQIFRYAEVRHYRLP